MSFANFAELLKKAQAGQYAVGAFNVFALEYLPAILEAAEEKRSPFILQINPIHFYLADTGPLVQYISRLAEKSPVPVALNLDHGISKNVIEQGIDFGFPSVMFDGSKLTFEENLKETRAVVELCRPKGITVEAELGVLNDEGLDVESEATQKMFTDPARAAEFVSYTQIDALAVSIGNAHGFYKGKPKLDFARLLEIRQSVDIPLVLHGGSGIPDEDLQMAVRSGITKLNINTDMSAASAASVKNDVRDKEIEEIEYPALLFRARQAVKSVVKKKIEVLGSGGKA